MIVIDKTDASFAPLAMPDPREKGGHITFIIKRCYTIQPDGTLSSYSKDEQPAVDGDKQYADDLGPAVRYPSDIPDHKPMVDVVVNGHACAPEGTEVQQLTAAIEVAGRRKALEIFGDRFWQVDRDGTWYMTEPTPFARMPLRWEKAYGSLYDMRNPIGKGGDADPMSDPNDPDYPLPNIEDPNALIRDPSDQPTPVNFGAIPIHWQPRDQKFGTRDMFWATFRAPKLPNDHDPRYHNAAPDDQQVESLVGDEVIRCENMDPAKPFRRIHLPGSRPRLFYVPREDAARELREVSVALDTLVVDLDSNETTLVWRGAMHHSYDWVDERIAYIYLNEEPVTEAPRSRETYQELFEKEIPDYEYAFEVANNSGEKMHNQLFGPVQEQIIKTLQEVEADDSLIQEFKQATDAEEIFNLAKTKSDEMSVEIRKMLKDLGGDV